METNIQKWGNSLGVRLSKSITDSHSLKAGSRVQVVETKNGIEISALKKPSFLVADMVKKITKDNLHAEMDWGAPRGNELW